LPNPRILIVDDYPGARYRRMRLLLDEGDFDVAEETLGRDAIRRVAQERFDLAVVDLHLPDISGLDVCRGIRENASTAALPVLMVSAVSETDEAERLSRTAGATGFVSDAADGAAFVRAVRDTLR
jgi:CheY-like chemotaxis protein